MITKLYKGLVGLILVLALASVAGVTLSAQSGNCMVCSSGSGGTTSVFTGNVIVPGTMQVSGASTFAGITNTGTSTFTGGALTLVTTVTTDNTLSVTNCGGVIAVTAAADTHTTTLPAQATVGLGCSYTFINVGANGGQLLDISPNAADGIVGGVTLAASVVYFSGTADADIGLTKATGKQGDFIRITTCATNTWCVTGSQGIWANN